MILKARALASGLFLLAALPVQTAATALHESIALVYQVKGDAQRIEPGRSREPVHLYDRLPAETTLDLASGSRLTLAFVTGKRYEISGPARATLGKGDLGTRSGGVRALPPVPALPRLAPISEKDHPGPSAGAVRIRGERISGLHPDREVTSLASAIRLRFDPVPVAPKYHLQIVDRDGKILFSTDTQAAEVNVPPDLLAPGGTYLWTVETLDRPGPVARGEATLMTLDADQVRAREELQHWVQSSGTRDDLKLLDGVNRALGLSEEIKKEDAHCPLAAPGLVVETVSPESAAFRAGLMPGDQLLSWCRSAGEGGGCIARGDLRSPFDWLDVQMDDVQRGGVVVEGTRGPENLHWNLLPTVQGITVAPLLQGALAEAYQYARKREKAGEPVSAAKELAQAAELAERNRCADAALWLRAQAAQLHVKARQWPEADADYQAVLSKAQALGVARVEEHLRMSWSDAFIQRGDATRARQQLESALALEEKNHPEGLGVVSLLIRLGNVLKNMQDDQEEAERLYSRAYDLALRTAPGSGAEAAGANNLAISAYTRGDLEQTQQYAARALAIREKLTPWSDAIIPALVIYGDVLYSRGDLAGAEAVYLRARGILEKFQPDSGNLAKILHDLGEVAHQRGDDDAAENLYRRELALFERVDPSGIKVRDSLMGLGAVELRRGQGAKAEETWQHALAISEKLNARGNKSAMCLAGLAEAAMLQGRSADAERLFRQALALEQEINPEGLDAGIVHAKLGLLLLNRGDVEASEPHLRAAIRIREKNHAAAPEEYQALARLQARRGRREEATASYLAAINALEAQRTRLGGAQESQWLYGSSLGDLYFEAAEHQIALRRSQEAWRLIERGRARGFQEMLAQRDLRFAGEVPPPLYAERRRLDADYDKTQAALANWMPEQGAEKMEALQGRLRDLRLEQGEVQEKIWRSSPRLASLESSAPLDLAAARSALDPSTVLLTYAVGDSRSFLFVIEADGAAGPGFFFYSLPVGRKGLEKEIVAFRNLLERPETRLSVLKQRGRHLYDLLLRPARPRLAKAQRWLVSPDGPLHSLPFAALVSGKHYLAESKPIHVVASASVYKEIKSTRSEKSSATMDLLAVGDPVYPAGIENPAEAARDPQMQDALRRGLSLKPLPATRSEVEAISKLFPGARILLGNEATEEAAKSLAPQARRLHFACHGLLDEKFPLNSALALSIPDHPQEGRDNGLLQAWEIFDELRLDADLVTLSACDSGLGKEMGGEGLVGLVRAFQFAGSRSVLASLWGVGDVSTSRFMERFYQHLHDGLSKDEALRAAQVDQIREKSASSHPFHWAAFELFGDWR
jgi:CHAT domain-containing protein/tetratricopeptide (TPR) repeat protein